MSDTSPARQDIRIAVDIGGTFVDAIALDMTTGDFILRKALTTPAAPWEGVMAAVARLGIEPARFASFIHGTTLGLNAVLERRGARTGIITNDGFRDIFIIGRGNVPDAHMYDFQYERPPSLVKRRWIKGVTGRLDYRGRELTPLDEAGVREAARELVEDEGVAAIAICFLFSFRDPSHERRAAAIIREAFPSVRVSISSDITREHREYERTSTTVLDAYIRPIFERYVDRLEGALRDGGFDGRFMITRSGGGAMTAAAAKLSPTETIMSGPAGGIIGGAFLGRALDRHDLISFDVGGTSLDVCLIEGGVAVAAGSTELEQYPLLVTCYDIRTIGAGGGSIASVDDGLLKVGPRSAGADPGPVCYGRGGTEPTVSDAALVLGYLDPERFLGGAMTLAGDAARDAIAERIGVPLGLDVIAAAAGIFDVMAARVVGAVRQITVERGHDPRDFSLLAFGGAGPLVAPLVAREMGMREVIVPGAPAGFSAWGMLSADIVNDTARTDLRILDEVDLAELEALFRDMEAEALRALAEQDVPATEAVAERLLELRYLGQEHALTVPVGTPLDRPALLAAFHGLHEVRYGHRMAAPVQILTVRVRGLGRAQPLNLKRLAPAAGGVERARLGERQAFCFARRTLVAFAVYDRSRLAPGDHIAGPALIDEGTSITVLHTGQDVTVNDYGHLLVTGTGAAW